MPVIQHIRALWVVLVLVVAAAPLSVAFATLKAEDVKLMSTPDGVEFGVWGGKEGQPSPTLILLSGNIVDSFTKPNFLRAGQLLVPQGYLCVSIDLPNHATQAKKGYSGLVGWGKRAGEGDDFVAEFNGRMKQVLDYLVAQGMTDPEKIAVTGTSRGGFLAIRYMAFDSRVKCVVGYAPVTDLRKLKEFDIAKDVPGVDAMNLESHVAELVGKPVLMFIGDRDDRVGTDAAFHFLQKLSAAAVKADVPTNAELHILSEPRGHSLPPGIEGPAARWIYRVLEGKELPGQ